MSDINVLKIDSMITPVIINVVYKLLGIIACGLGALATLVFISQGEIWCALISPVIGCGTLVLIRISCEIALILFKIHDYLQNINAKISTVRTAKITTKS